MKSTNFERLGGWMAILSALFGLLYAISFVALRNQLLYSLCFTLLGLFSIVALIAVYERLRETDGAYALLALLFALVGAVGMAIHGGYDLANAINPPESVLPGALDLPSQIDPRGLLAFGFTGIGLFTFAWLMTRSNAFPKSLGYLGYLTAILFIVIYLGRLIVLSPTNPILLVPVLLNGFIISPLFYLWLGLVLMRSQVQGMGTMPMTRRTGDTRQA